jgi:hypothetical protein
MDILNRILDGILRLYCSAFSWLPSIVGLSMISIAAGISMLWLFRKTSNATKIRAVKRQAKAHLLELLIYGDDPVITWRAQKSLFRANLRHVALMLQPACWTLVPFVLLVVHLDGVYGVAPIPVYDDTVVTVQMRTPIDFAGPAPLLTPPAGIVVETPAVRLLEQRQISWRIRAVAVVSSKLWIDVSDNLVDKAIEAGGTQRLIASRRVRSSWEALWHPGESRIPSGNVEWVEVGYPYATIEAFGIRMHWLIWFILISMSTVLLLKNTFRVTF